MNTNILFQLCLYLSVSILYANRRCLECSRLTQPLDCSTVTECGSHEVCYMDKYVTNDGLLMYDIGCRDPQICSVSSSAISFGKRDKDRRSATLICSKCCDDKDICNLDSYCDAEKFHPPPGSKLCFKCAYSAAIDDCNQITLCDQDSLCSIKQTKNIIGDSRWTHECAHKTQCDKIAASSSRGLCASCCADNLCNLNCTMPPTTIAPPTTPTTTTQAPLTKPIITSININPPFINYGDNVRIECIATGNEKPTIDFLFRSSTLPANMHLANPPNPANVLTITNFLPMNEGMYRCIADNNQGDTHRDFHLTGH